MKKRITKPSVHLKFHKQTVLDVFDEVITEILPPETLYEEVPQVIEDVDLPELSDDDPETESSLIKMRSDIKDVTARMIPQMYDKFVNASSKDAVAVFEAMADRADITRPDKNKPGATMNNLILTSSDLVPLLEGMLKITESTDD